MSININAKKLGDYLVKVTANTEIGDGKFIFTENGMTSLLKDLSGVILINGQLNRKAFNTYETGTILNVQDTRRFIQALKLFNGDVNIIVKDNMAQILDENGSFDFVLPEKVESHYDGDVPVFSVTKPITINKSLTDGIISACKIIDTSEIVIINENAKTSFNIGKESNKANKTIRSTVIEKSKIDLSTDSFCSVFGILGPVFDLRLPKGDGVIPVLINEKNEDYDIVYIISPIIDLDEDSKEPEAIIKTAPPVEPVETITPVAPVEPIAPVETAPPVEPIAPVERVAPTEFPTAPVNQ